VAGRRQNERSLRYWEGILRTIDPVRFPPSRGPEQPRYWQGEFHSPVMLPAVQAISAHGGVETSTALLALFGLALNETTGINPVVVRPIVSNRFRPGLADVVCTLAQGGLCVLDVGGMPFDAALQRVQRATMNAYKHSYFDHDDMVALRARVTAERGENLDTAAISTTAAHGPPAGDRRVDPDAAGPRDPATHDLPMAPRPGQPLVRALVRPHRRRPDAVQVTVYLDTHSISRADGEALLHAMESIAVAAALDLPEVGVVAEVEVVAEAGAADAEAAEFSGEAAQPVSV